MKTRNEKVSEFLNNLSIDIDLQYYNNTEEFQSFEEIENYLNDNGIFNQEGEVIYYSNAIEYLKENDPSLNESLSIAAELGFSPENLNSEVLASLLKSQNLSVEFQELETEITDFFNELEEEEEEEED